MATVRTIKKPITPAKKSPAKATLVKRRTVATKPLIQAARKSTVKAPSKPVPRQAVVATTKASLEPKKVKLVRDSFSFPKHEHAFLTELKVRAEKLGHEFKKSEILRAGLQHLVSMADSALLAALSKVQRIKTGRPGKKSKKK